jgi:predicted  nucleic acid-binding Zn-ribbon protein
VHDLPAYVALERWVAARRVVVVGAADPAGCERLLSAGAREILVVGAGVPAAGVSIHPPTSALPLRDQSVDLVVVLRGDAGIDLAGLSDMIEESDRVLRSDGLLALWVAPAAAAAAAAAARGRFAALSWVAAVPWSMMAMTPVGGDPAARRVIFSEAAAPTAAPPLRYLLVASRGEAAVADECVLMPLAEIEAAAALRAALASAEAAREAEGALARRLAELESVRAVEGEGVEAVRAGADIARDRDRLRDELARRTSELEAIEERVWRAEEAAQKERIENVRLVTEVDRLREQLERSRGVELERLRELEAQGQELRRLELAHAEHASASGEPPAQVVSEGPERGDSAALKEMAAREHASAELARRRERELVDAAETIAQLRRSVDEYAAVAANLRGELVVVQVEVEQLQATVPGLHQQLAELRAKLRGRDEEAGALQQKLEAASAEQEHLRQRLRDRLRELEGLRGQQAALSEEAVGLRVELELCRQAMSLYEATTRGDQPIEVLRAELAAQSRRFAEEQGRLELRLQQTLAVEATRSRRALLEASVRADEQEHLLYRLDGCEQRIWEMNDAADRNAARVAASLAQYQKLREQLEDLVHELEMTRGLLADAEAQVMELERGVASERARSSRRGGEHDAQEGAATPVAPAAASEEAPVIADALAGSHVGGGFELDEDLLRLTDAILAGESGLAAPHLEAERSSDDFDAEMNALLGDDADALSVPVAREPDDADVELLAEVELALSTARKAAASVELAAAAAQEPTPLADSGIIIEMIGDDEAWPDQDGFGVTPSELTRLGEPAPAIGDFVDFDLDVEDEETVGITVEDEDERPAEEPLEVGISLDDEDAVSPRRAAAPLDLGVPLDDEDLLGASLAPRAPMELGIILEEEDDRRADEAGELELGIALDDDDEL